MKSNYEEKLGTSKMLPLILKMALPAVAAQLVNLLYSLVDRMYIGHINDIGTDALAGIGVTSSVIVLISALSYIVSGGGAPLAAISLGRGDRKKAEKILGNGFILLIAFTILTSALTYIFMTPLLSFVGASDVTLKYASDYLSIYLLGTLFVQITLGLNNFISTQGRPILSMVSVIIGAAINLILDPIFIFYFGMGIKGAALATIISQAVSAIWVLSFLLSKHASLRLQFKYMKLDPKVISAMFALGVSPFVMASTESIVGFVLNSTLKNYGDIYISTLTIMQSAMQIVSVPLAGFAQGVIPVLSYNYGHGNKERLKEGFKIFFKIMLLGTGLPIIFMMIFPSIIANLFTNNQVLIDMVSKMLPLFLAGMTIFGLQRACQNTFVALGQAKVSLFIAILRKIILLVPLAILLPKVMGVRGVYAAEAIADATAAICCMTIFLFQFPKILSEMPSPQSK